MCVWLLAVPVTGPAFLAAAWAQRDPVQSEGLGLWSAGLESCGAGTFTFCGEQTGRAQPLQS